MIDSGSQYPYGTTDITRTISKGEVSDSSIKEKYTLVLKGIINNYLRKDVTEGSDIDRISRSFLKEKGFDYGSGTGYLFFWY